ncbi:hypothetical protein P3G55_02655 [Leptospira sp. 96542]|nr:hypothetical protein [Leptospira sp. 96542]
MTKILSLGHFILESFIFIPELILGWVYLVKKIFVSLFIYWKGKILFDKLFFLALLVQMLFSLMPWFQYQIQFYDVKESVNLGPKLNSIFILIGILNFFFLGFWKSGWTRIWFFATELVCIIFVLWGYLEPNRFFFEFVNHKEIQFLFTFYIYLTSLLVTFVLGYLTFQKEDKIFL